MSTHLSHPFAMESCRNQQNVRLDLVQAQPSSPQKASTTRRRLMVITNFDQTLTTYFGKDLKRQGFTKKFQVR